MATKLTKFDFNRFYLMTLEFFLGNGGGGDQNFLRGRGELPCKPSSYSPASKSRNRYRVPLCYLFSTVKHIKHFLIYLASLRNEIRNYNLVTCIFFLFPSCLFSLVCFAMHLFNIANIFFLQAKSSCIL